MSKTKTKKRQPAATIAASLRSLAGHLYRMARAPGAKKDGTRAGLREAALHAVRRAVQVEDRVKS